VTDQVSLQKPLPEDILAFRQSLDLESDRGCALFSASFIDEALATLLKASLVSDNKTDQALFNGTAPLATFSSRISMSFYLGKLPAACRQDLEIVRRIRNEFAHRADSISFSDPAIADRCNALRFSLRDKNASPRAHFTSAIFALLALIHEATIDSSAPSPPEIELPDLQLKAKIEGIVSESN
jgi:DNA-binding MltR family transcriptional regulator